MLEKLTLEPRLLGKVVSYIGSAKHKRVKSNWDLSLPDFNKIKKEKTNQY